ncbi:protein phosphatase methylesterase 1-like [Anneissia japonica]|uniref:protein phosphatase methylesterase 1-like n=1 Tax=Anneissia japonica TaxID=1529436 RepID=UPI0014255EFD|nr:protein phosphatase methylesterase 1-like [Anneissia japonica]
MSALHKNTLLKNTSSLPSKHMLPPSAINRSSGSSTSNRTPQSRKRDFTPLPWSSYFTSYQDVKIDKENIFRVYEKGEAGPVVVLLHGGGFSGLTWAVMSSVLIQQVKCRVIAMDMRGHGETKTLDESDMSAETLASDVGKVIETVFQDKEAPPIILVGHSMGGAIAVHAANKNVVPNLRSLVVIDVVEGSALEALHSMQSFLRGRPSKFKSLQYAIEYMVKSGQIRNIESARVSTPGHLIKCQDDKIKEDLLQQCSGLNDAIKEEDEEEVDGNDVKRMKKEESGMKEECSEKKSQDSVYTWRVNLANTEQYWRGWFEGLSELFLSCPVPKLLLLAGVDRLDRALTVGQMQGKFQMLILPQCGHAVHEDQPQKVADALCTFLTRHKMAEALSGFERPSPCC